MHSIQRFAVCFFAVIGATVSVSFITPCKPNDTACIKKSAIQAFPVFIAGVDELGLPAGDPMHLDNVQSNDNNFKLGFRNMTVTGFSKCNILDFSRNTDESTMTLVAECPIIATGKYSLSGKVLFILAEGNGDFKINTGKIKISVTAKVKVVEKANAKHWKITKFDYNYDIIDKASITLENLFGGDETKAKPFQEVLENSSTEIIKEVGGPVVDEIIKKLVEHVQKFLYAMPISKLES